MKIKHTLTIAETILTVYSDEPLTIGNETVYPQNIRVGWYHEDGKWDVRFISVSGREMNKKGERSLRKTETIPFSPEWDGWPEGFPQEMQEAVLNSRPDRLG